MKQQVNLTKWHKTFARDAVIRYPALRLLQKLGHENMFPVVVERVEKLDNHLAGSGNELTLIIPSDGKQCNFLYNAEALEHDSITRLVSQFAIFLQGIITFSAQPIAALPLLSKQERHKILVEWNNTQVDYPQDVLIHQLFEAQVERTPDAVAVVYEDKELTYQELNCRANQVAHYLQKLGVGPEVLVGLYFERSIEMIVGLLGVLKAGGAYVPLDSNYPRQRLEDIFADIQPSVLLTQKRLLSGVPNCRIASVCLDTGWAEFETENAHNPISKVQSNHLAYVIYTSGTTGKPKGVAVEHLGVVNMLMFRITEQQTREDVAVVPFFLSICFDASVSQIFSTLALGGKLILVSSFDTLHNSRYANKITTIGGTPSALEVYLSNSKIPKSVRLVGVGAEPISMSLAPEIATILPYQETY